MRRHVHLLVAFTAVASTLAIGSPVSAGPASCDTRVNNTHAKLQECVTLAGVREHQGALQAIADANNGTRVSGSLGFDQSADYAEGVFRSAGYNVTRQAFTFQTFVSLAPSVLEQVAPGPVGPVVNNIMSYSGRPVVGTKLATSAARTPMPRSTRGSPPSSSTCAPLGSPSARCGR